MFDQAMADYRRQSFDLYCDYVSAKFLINIFKLGISTRS